MKFESTPGIDPEIHDLADKYIRFFIRQNLIFNGGEESPESRFSDSDMLAEELEGIIEESFEKCELIAKEINAIWNREFAPFE